MQYALYTSGISAFTSIAWDHSSSHPRLATGSVDGTVVIWTAEPQPPSQAPGDEPAVISGLLSENILGITTASPRTSPPRSPTPSVKDLPDIDTTMAPSINIINATPASKLTVPLPSD